jgi:hypothetical protein
LKRLVIKYHSLPSSESLHSSLVKSDTTSHIEKRKGNKGSENNPSSSRKGESQHQQGKRGEKKAEVKRAGQR